MNSHDSSRSSSAAGGPHTLAMNSHDSSLQMFFHIWSWAYSFSALFNNGKYCK